MTPDPIGYLVTLAGAALIAIAFTLHTHDRRIAAALVGTALLTVGLVLVLVESTPAPPPIP